jgi:NAD(P)H-dependent FMN reductase
MKKVLAFAGSNNSQSINAQLLDFATSLLQDVEVQVLDIRNWEVPMYSIDMDSDQTPEKIAELIGLIQAHDSFIIASPEHNGGPSAFLKNILDWLSRRQKNAFDGKPVLVLSTSPGPGGGATHLNYFKAALPYQGATVTGAFSLPSFYDNFKEGKVTQEHLGALQQSLDEFLATVSE